MHLNINIRSFKPFSSKEYVSARLDTRWRIDSFVVFLFLPRLRIVSLAASVYCMECDGFTLLNPYINYFADRGIEHMFLLLNPELNGFEIIPQTFQSLT